MQARALAMLALVPLLACGDGMPTGAVPETLSLTKIGGDEQTGAVGTVLSEPVTVLVERTDETGNPGPVEGVTVTFVVTEGGGSVEAGTVLTDEDGIAADHWRLGPQAGSNALEATAEPEEGRKRVRVVFTAQGEARPPAFVELSPLAAGKSHSCALDSAGTVHCWGRGTMGQLGDGGMANRTLPGPVSGARGFVSVVAGMDHTCGLTTLGSAYCWGRNDAGQLGDGTVVHRSVPTAVQSAPTFVSLTAGDHHTCGLTPVGTVFCWGLNGFGQLGDGTTRQRSLPVEVGGDVEFVMLVAGNGHSCGLDPAGRVYCWGWNGFGQLGDGTTVQRSAPTPMDGSGPFLAVAGGGWHTCGLAASGTAYCWGDNSVGQLGDGTVRARFSAAPVAGSVRFRSLVARSLRTCGIERDSGTAYCWGHNLEGQLGDGTTFNRTLPTAVGGDRSFLALTTGFEHGCGTATSGEALCWGRNDFGQLGDGTVARRLAPTQVLGWPPS